MLIAEFTLDHPVLRDALTGVPGITISWEDSYPGPDGRIRLIVWIESDDFDAVDAAIRADSTVTNPVVLAETGGRRLYRLEQIGEGIASSIMAVLVEVGGVQQQLVGDRDGWHNRTRFPDRNAFERVYQFCVDHDIGFTFEQIYEQSNWRGAEVNGLSEPQHETLVEAVESGYLDIPRKSSLAELGARLGVSESAASERFRRGVKKLIQLNVIQ